MVYFAQDKNNRIKIGVSYNPTNRIKNLQKEYGDLTVLKTIKGDHKLETKLHKKFKHLRIINEWFRPEKELLDFIEVQTLCEDDFRLLPQVYPILQKMGSNIKLARLRRKISTQQLCERAGITRPTLLNIEKGKENVSIGIIATVLNVLNQEETLREVAQNDKLGRKLQDLELLNSEL
jgi:DNA-binding XRE family transcriptional regulator